MSVGEVIWLVVAPTALFVLAVCLYIAYKPDEDDDA